MRVLITGVSGFAGSHLARFLSQKKDIQLYGISRKRFKVAPLMAELKNRLHFLTCDLQDALKVKKIISMIKPDRIFHLAGQSFVPESIAFPRETLSENIFGQFNLLEAVKTLRIAPLIHMASSATVYGSVTQKNLPIGEGVPFKPASPYAVSKAAQELLGFQYFNTYGLKIVQTRAFSHIGPGQDPRFAISYFAREIALIEAGKKKPVIQLGNLKTSKDFTDVRDMVRAYALSLEKGKPGEVYNVCSGKVFKIEDILGRLIAISGLKIRIRTEAGRLRSYEMPVLWGDPSKFKRISGWKPEISIDQTLKDILEDWKTKIAARSF